MSAQKPRFKLQRPRFIHFLIALLLSLLIMERGATWLFTPKAGSRDIILYTTDWCPYCESLRLYLKSYNIPFKERDVEKTMAGTAGWFVLGHGRGVPISVVGEKVVYGYDLEKINGALRALNYSIQGPGDTGNAEPGYLPTGAIGAQPAASGSACAPAEQFEAFYAKFKADKGFRIQRTRFPLRKHVLSGSKPYLTTDEATEIARDQVLTEQEPVYLDYEILEAGGYSQSIQRSGEGLMEISTGPEGEEPLTIHKFQSMSGCWFFVEYVSYEYFGSLMILSAL